MKKILVLPALVIFISTSAFSMQSWEMMKWKRNMEQLARAGNEAAIDQEQRHLETASRQAVPGSKEAQLIEKKLAKINSYRVME